MMFLRHLKRFQMHQRVWEFPGQNLTLAISSIRLIPFAYTRTQQTVLLESEFHAFLTSSAPHGCSEESFFQRRVATAFKTMYSRSTYRDDVTCLIASHGSESPGPLPVEKFQKPAVSDPHPVDIFILGAGIKDAAEADRISSGLLFGKVLLLGTYITVQLCKPAHRTCSQHYFCFLPSL